MSTEAIVFFAQTIVLPATMVANLLIALIVSVSSYRTTKKLVALETLRGIDQQWQSLNSAILQQPQIQHFINPEDHVFSERTIVRRNVVFYVLNLTLHVVRSRAAGLIDPITAAGLESEQARFLEQLRPELDEIVAGSTILSDRACPILDPHPS